MPQILFLPPLIFDSYVSLIHNKIFFDTLCKISNLSNLGVASWDFSCLLSPVLCSPHAYNISVSKLTCATVLSSFDLFSISFREN